MASYIKNNKFDKFKGDLHREMRRRTQSSAEVVHDYAKGLISTDGTSVRAKGGKLRSGRKVRKGSLIYGGFPSRPGEPPHTQRGRLKASVAWEMVSDFMARVGTNVKYGRWLELGTKRLAARPWLRRALRDRLNAVRAIMTAPWKWAG